MELGEKVLYDGLAGRVGVVKESSEDSFNKGDKFRLDQYFGKRKEPWKFCRIHRVWKQLLSGSTMLTLQDEHSIYHAQDRYFLEVLEPTSVGEIVPRVLVEVDFPPIRRN